MNRPRHTSLIVGTLFAIAACFLLFDFLSTHDLTTTSKAPSDTFNAATAQLDDPLGRKHANAARGSGAAASGQARDGSSSANSSSRGTGSPAGFICSNTCYKARDGVCDEGRRGNLTLAAGMNLVNCDLGTDCDDCGPWQGVQHGPAWSESVGPIAYLRLYNIDVWAKQVPVAPKFIFAFTDPNVDQDQSTHMRATGIVEGGISHVFFKVLSKRCNASQPGASGFVIDVGANFGWFSLLSAALGCSVLSIEPVPIFRAFLEYSAARNHLTSLIELIPAVVAPDVTKTYTINAPLVSGAQWGASGMDVPNHPGTMQIPARAVRLDDLAYAHGNSSSSSSSSLRALLQALEAGSGSSSSGSSKGGTKVKVTVTSSSSQDGDGKGAAGDDGDDGIGASAAADASSDAALPARGSTRSAPGGGPSAPGARAGGGGAGKAAARPPLRSRLLPAKLASGGVDILKVDVEGREPDVFATAARLLDSGAVDNIIMEYSPGYYYQASDRLADMESLPLLLLDVLRHNYSMVHIPWSIAHDVRAAQQAGSWDVPLPTMDAITPPQLAYDLWTTQHIRNGTLPGMYGPTSWPCPEMAKSGMAFSEPGYERFALHVAFHPKAFMANFVFNTNVWATHSKGLQQPGTGLINDRELFPFWWPSDAKWFPQSATQDTHPFGLPWAFCEHVAHKFQVAHRCRCRNWDACGQHQVAVQQCVQKKHTGYTNIGDELMKRMLDDAAAATAAAAPSAASPPAAA